MPTESMSHTKARVIQYIVILLILALAGGGYWYWKQAQASVITNVSGLGTATVNTSQNSNITSGLVGLWSFDGADVSGTTSYDRSGQGNNGTLAGTTLPTPTIGKLGQALSFDGVSGYVSVPYTSSLGFGGTTNLSLSAWVNFVSFPIVSCNGNAIIANGNDSSTGAYGFLVGDTGGCGSQTGNKVLNFNFRDSGGAQYKAEITVPGNIVLGKWYLLSGTYDGTSITVYVNGVAIGSSAATATIGSNTNPITIGNNQGNPSAYRYYVNGSLDEVRIYNRALSASEISDLYRQGTATVNASRNDELTSGLVGLWSFDGADVSGTTAYDRSGNANNGTLTNSPTPTIGQAGQAIDFDGSNNYVSAADAASLDFGDTADLALTGWFYRDTFTTDDTIVAKRNGVAAGDIGYIAYIDDATDKFTFEVSDGIDEYQLESSSTFAATGWNHFTLVWDENSAAGTTLYVNGAYETTVATGTIGNIGDLSNALTLQIGAESDNGNPFDGKLDEVRVYNRVLTAAEVWGRYLAEGTDKQTCGTVTDTDGNIYGTVVIGSQCWMRQSMRVGTRIAAATSQTNNGTIEKYCYSNTDANCTAANPNQPDGGLYQWNEAMQYSTTAGARGICPAGWHIPTDAEQYTLENYLKDAGQTCNASRSGYDCSSAGTKLKPGGASRFEGNLAGYANAGSFGNRGANGLWWSSSESGPNAWYRYLNSSYATVSRNADVKSYGLSVRCVQD